MTAFIAAFVGFIALTGVGVFFSSLLGSQVKELFRRG